MYCFRWFGPEDKSWHSRKWDVTSRQASRRKRRRGVSAGKSATSFKGEWGLGTWGVRGFLRGEQSGGRWLQSHWSLLGQLVWQVYIYVIPLQLLPFGYLIEVIPGSDVVVNVIWLNCQYYVTNQVMCKNLIRSSFDDQNEIHVDGLHLTSFIFMLWGVSIIWISEA